jgi:hypothetical protein
MEKAGRLLSAAVCPLEPVGYFLRHRAGAAHRLNRRIRLVSGDKAARQNPHIRLVSGDKTARQNRRISLVSGDKAARQKTRLSQCSRRVRPAVRRPARSYAHISDFAAYRPPRRYRVVTPG